MNLSVVITIFVVSIMTKDMKFKQKINRYSTVIWIIMGILMILMAGYLTFNYFNTSTDIDDYKIIEKVYEEKGIVIYTISEEGKEKYLILKEGVFDKVFLQTKSPVQELVETDINTFKYKHHIAIENSVFTHTYKKNWGEGVVSFWLVLFMGIYNVPKNKMLSNTDKIVGGLWLIITVGVTIFFII